MEEVEEAVEVVREGIPRVGPEAAMGRVVGAVMAAAAMGGGGEGAANEPVVSVGTAAERTVAPTALDRADGSDTRDSREAVALVAVVKSE